ncbi:MAG: tyrosine-type recombinase/integrase [Cellulosilyticaceae bacterium]
MPKMAMQKGNITTFDELFNSFMKNCNVKNVSPHTIIFYDSCYKSISNFKEDIFLEDINFEFVQDYIISLKKDNNPNSINTRLRGLRAILNYGYNIGIMRKIKVQMIRVDKEVKETYSHEQIAKLLKKPNLKKCTFAEYRNWMLVNWFISTGNRLSTVTNIKIGDLDLNNQLVTLKHTKNRNQQIIPLSSMLCKHLSEYLTFRKGSDEDYLFPNVEGTKLCRDGITSAIKYYNLSRGVQMHSVHAFRRYFAKQCVLNGVDIFTLQKLGGWKDLGVVKNYVEIYANDVKNYDDVNPLDNMYRKTTHNPRISMQK